MKLCCLVPANEGQSHLVKPIVGSNAAVNFYNLRYISLAPISNYVEAGLKLLRCLCLCSHHKGIKSGVPTTDDKESYAVLKKFLHIAMRNRCEYLLKRMRNVPSLQLHND